MKKMSPVDRTEESEVIARKISSRAEKMIDKRRKMQIFIYLFIKLYLKRVKKEPD